MRHILAVILVATMILFAGCQSDDLPELPEGPADPGLTQDQGNLAGQAVLSEEAYETYSRPIEDFYIETEVDAEDQSVAIEVSAQDTIVYWKGYVFVENQWRQFGFSGERISQDWLRADANDAESATLEYPITESSENNYVIIYTCSLVGQAFDCHDDKWQIKQFSIEIPEPCEEGVVQDEEICVDGEFVPLPNTPTNPVSDATLASYPEYITKPSLQPFTMVIGDDVPQYHISRAIDIQAQIQSTTSEVLPPVTLVLASEYTYTDEHVILLGEVCSNYLIAEFENNPPDCEVLEENQAQIQLTENPQYPDKRLLVVHARSQNAMDQAVKILSGVGNPNGVFYTESDVLCIEMQGDGFNTYESKCERTVSKIAEQVSTNLAVNFEVPIENADEKTMIGAAELAFNNRASSKCKQIQDVESTFPVLRCGFEDVDESLIGSTQTFSYDVRYMRGSMQEDAELESIQGEFSRLIQPQRFDVNPYAISLSGFEQVSVDNSFNENYNFLHYDQTYTTEYETENQDITLRYTTYEYDLAQSLRALYDGFVPVFSQITTNGFEIENEFIGLGPSAYGLYEGNPAVLWVTSNPEKVQLIVGEKYSEEVSDMEVYRAIDSAFKQINDRFAIVQTQHWYGEELILDDIPEVTNPAGFMVDLTPVYEDVDVQSLSEASEDRYEEMIWLQNSRISTHEGTTSVEHSLLLGDQYVLFEENYDDEHGYYLMYDGGEPIYTYSVTYADSLLSDVFDGVADDLVGESLELMGNSYSILSATADDTSVQMKLMHNGLTDTLTVGQTRTYTFNGYDYEVELQATEANTQDAIFLINGQAIQVGEKDVAKYSTLRDDETVYVGVLETLQSYHCTEAEGTDSVVIEATYTPDSDTLTQDSPLVDRFTIESGQKVDFRGTEIVVLVLSEEVVRFVIDGDVIDALELQDTYQLDEQSYIQVIELNKNQECVDGYDDSLVEFSLSAEGLVELEAASNKQLSVSINEEDIEDISGFMNYSLDNDRLAIYKIEWTLETDAKLGTDIYLAPGEDIAEKIDEPEGLFGLEIFNAGNVGSGYDVQNRIRVGKFVSNMYTSYVVPGLIRHTDFDEYEFRDFSVIQDLPDSSFIHDTAKLTSATFRPQDSLVQVYHAEFNGNMNGYVDELLRVYQRDYQEDAEVVEQGVTKLEFSNANIYAWRSTLDTDYFVHFVDQQKSTESQNLLSEYLEYYGPKVAPPAEPSEP